MQKKSLKTLQDLIKSMHLILSTALPCFENPLQKKTRLETKNVPPIPPHFLQRWWCKWWLYNVHIMRRNQVLSQPWEVVCWILHGKECLRQPNNIYYTLYIIYKIYISLKKARRGTNRWRVHWCQTRALNEDMRLNIRSEEPAENLLFFIGKIFDIVVFFIGII